MQNRLSPGLLEIKVGVFLSQSKELRDIINVKLSPVTLVIGLKVSAKVSQLQVILPPTKTEEDLAASSSENKDSCPTHKTKSCVVNFPVGNYLVYFPVKYVQRFPPRPLLGPVAQ